MPPRHGPSPRHFQQADDDDIHSLIAGGDDDERQRRHNKTITWSRTVPYHIPKKNEEGNRFKNAKVSTDMKGAKGSKKSKNKRKRGREEHKHTISKEFLRRWYKLELVYEDYFKGIRRIQQTVSGKQKLEKKMLWNPPPRSEVLVLLPPKVLAPLLKDFKQQPTVLRYLKEYSIKLQHAPGTVGTMFHWKDRNTPHKYLNGGWRASPYLSHDTQRSIDKLKGACFANPKYWKSFPGIFFTDSLQVQPLHYLHFGDDDVNHDKGKFSWIFYIPLQQEGCVLSVMDQTMETQVWHRKQSHPPSPKQIKQKFFHIPFGTAFGLRSDRFHSGLFALDNSVTLQVVFQQRSLSKEALLFGNAEPKNQPIIDPQEETKILNKVTTIFEKQTKKCRHHYNHLCKELRNHHECPKHLSYRGKSI